jgi:malate dehydrogenase (oxaloacetate-decarboxylating)(NADP+)
MRRRHTLIGAMMIHRREADGMLCGAYGTHDLHLKYIDEVIGRRPGVCNYYGMNVIMMPERTLFMGDTYVNPDPTAEQLAEMTVLAAEEIRRFGLIPKAALLSHSSFGTSNAPSAKKMRDALAILERMAPELEVEGEMHGDAALSPALRESIFPRSRLKGPANLLIMPTLDAANIAFNLLKASAGGGITIGPVLLGANAPIHIVTHSATVRRLVNMTALTVVDANAARRDLFDETPGRPGAAGRRA